MRAQTAIDKKADSLIRIIEKAEVDSQKLRSLSELCDEYKYIYPEICSGLIDQYFAKGHKSISKENIELLRYKGDVYWHLGLLDSAISIYTITYEFHRKNNNKKGMGQALGDIGYIEMEQGKYPESLFHYKEALKFARSINDEEYIGIVGIYISQLYDWMGDYQESLKMYHEMRLHFQKDKHQKRYGIVLMNIGAIHGNHKVTDSAIYYYNRALEILPITEEKTRTVVKINIAQCLLFERRDLQKIRVLLDEGHAVFEKLNSLSNLALVNYYEGLYNIETGNYPKAKYFLIKSIEHYKQENSMARLSTLYDRLSFVYEKQQKFDSAYYNFKLYKQFNDSVLIDLSEKNMSYQKIMFDTDKKALAIETLKQKEIIQKEQLDKEKIMRFGLYGGLFLLLVFGAFMFNRFKVTQKQKKIIEIKERETHYQKHIIEEKHREITDSINYAERIQRSFLATKDQLDEKLKDYFVLFQPKDVVSGDFYWSHQLKNGNFALVTADSTGHGVPGAIMSLLNTSSLERSVELGITEPAEILNHTRKTIIERLKKDGSSEGGKDGMDCSLIVLNKDKTKMVYSAANNPVWIVRNVTSSLSSSPDSYREESRNENKKELIELPPDKIPVGKHDRDSVSFTQHEVDLQTGDMIYTLTDGFPDQFGGPKGKKFMYKKLKKTLVSISGMPMNQQNDFLKNSLKEWMGNSEQVDDITIIGIRI